MINRKLCERCKRPANVCYCQQLTTLENPWPVYIFQYFKENKHPLNTAAIAKLGLSNCEILLSNDLRFEKKRDELIKQQPLLVYPGEDSVPIETLTLTLALTLTLEKPRPLIFLDGTWRKTRRLLYESPNLAQLTKISIQPDVLSRYRIRKAPDHRSFSTLEAIVYVLSLLENNPTKYQSLLAAMDLMVNKQIELMGLETFTKNYTTCN